jgi:hypothetical protein
MDVGIDGKTPVGSGGGAGLGWHRVRLLLGDWQSARPLAEGATVILGDLDQTPLQQTAAGLESSEGRLCGFAADVGDPESITRLKMAVS